MTACHALAASIGPVLNPNVWRDIDRGFEGTREKLLRTQSPSPKVSRVRARRGVSTAETDVLEPGRRRGQAKPERRARQRRQGAMPRGCCE